MRVLAFLLLGFALTFSFMAYQDVSADVLLGNGDFEDTTEPFPAGWTIMSGAPGQQAGLNGLGTALFLHKASAGGDRIYQTFDETKPEWDLDFYFASEEPAGAGERAMNLILNSPQTTLLNIRVEQSGVLQAHNGSLWVDLITDAVSFSVDENSDGDFDDVGDTLNVHHMRVRGNATAGMFMIDISAANEDGFVLSSTSDAWANMPGADYGITTLHFSASSSTCTGSSAIDEVVLTSVPEPGALVLLIGSLVSFLPRRRAH